MAHSNGAEERVPLLRSVVPHHATGFFRASRSGHGGARADYVISVFEPERSGPSPYARGCAVDDAAFFEMVDNVRASIEEGIQPRMISVGTSGSYFVRVRDGDETRIAGVFKPMDEEPYGNLNLIPNFSYLSEVGASFLDDRLELKLVPKTRLVGLASPAFHYLYRDRTRFERGQAPLPTKIGSLQVFLPGYENASQFFRHHSLPGRPRDLFERDLNEEHAAHRLSRRKERARLRMCFIALKRLLLCRYGPGPYGSPGSEDVPDGDAPPPLQIGCAQTAYPAAEAMTAKPCRDTFAWTARTWRELRLELEKLVVLDFLMRNTDRGLDNFMIHYNPHAGSGECSLRIGAIDNSLAFPHQHPRGLRDYPYGWLFLPTNLIGEPFSDETRALFLPKLTDPVWWATTIEGLRRIFSQDPHFNVRVFEDQMDVMRGQGYVLVQCLQRTDQGPIELCAYPKRLVRQSVHVFLPDDLRRHTFVDLAQGTTTRADERNDAELLPGLSPTPSAPSASMPMPQCPIALNASPEAEPLAIDVVEHINAQGKRASIASSMPTERLSSSNMAHTSSSATYGFSFDSDERLPRHMRSLDLAGSDAPPTKARHLPLRPVQVIVERLETETRRPLISWY